jgi:predicted RNA-binding protein with PIN domain
MAILIDGYNLLYASGILGRGRGPGFLERSRQALLNFLAESLEEKELARCTVVFDASDSAPKGLPRTITHRGILVKYASGLPSADELIEQLILEDTSPRKLIVVSSDHRLHRAAKRRKATPVDSDIWFSQTLRLRIDRQKRAAEPSAAKPPAPSTEGEIRFWMRAFGVPMEESIEPAEAEPIADAVAPSVDPEAPSDAAPLDDNSPFNPFPPGYADDLFDEESR